MLWFRVPLPNIYPPVPCFYWNSRLSVSMHFWRGTLRMPSRDVFVSNCVFHLKMFNLKCARSIMPHAVKLVTLRGKNDFKNRLLVLLRFSQWLNENLRRAPCSSFILRKSSRALNVSFTKLVSFIISDSIPDEYNASRPHRFVRKLTRSWISASGGGDSVENCCCLIYYFWKFAEK